jgi:hypothetical protein
VLALAPSTLVGDMMIDEKMTVPVALSIGFFCVVSGGLIRGITSNVQAGKVYPNQGIKLSFKNFWIVFLVVWLTFGPAFGFGVGAVQGLRNVDLIMPGIFGLILSFGFGLVCGLNRGGSAVIKHYALRLILWQNGFTPLKFIKFLDQCADLNLLEKIGGGYSFIHRMLLEYFTEMTPEPIRAEDETTAPK